MINIDYYMQEACGIFAVAYARLAGLKIMILSDDYGQPFNQHYKYEITHVVVPLSATEFVDIKGVRPLHNITEDFNLEIAYSLKGPFEPSEFKKKFMGNSDRFPLYGVEKDIKEATGIIRANPSYYGLVQ